MYSIVLLALVSLVSAELTDQQKYTEVKNSRNFTGKVVLVTGSDNGIGKEITNLFAQLGAHVVITGRNKERVNSSAKEAQNLSPNKLKPLEVVADITKTEDLTRLLNETIKTFGKLDVLVNNAGIWDLTTVRDKNYLKVFDDSIKISLRPVLELSQLAVPYLEKTNGTIISTSSITHPWKTSLAYAIAKRGIDITTQTLALELAPKIRVNAVSPGFVNTYDFKKHPSPSAEKIVSRAKEITPLKRLSEPFEIARGVVFLASTDAQFITGANLVIDGGLVYTISGDFPN